MIKKEYIFLTLIAIAFFSGGFFTKKYIDPTEDYKETLDKILENQTVSNAKQDTIISLSDKREKKAKLNVKKNAKHVKDNYDRTFSNEQLDSIERSEYRNKRKADSIAKSVGL